VTPGPRRRAAERGTGRDHRYHRRQLETIVKHYLGRDPRLADSAIDTLSDFVAQEMAG
jgi:hypothetical protein